MHVLCLLQATSASEKLDRLDLTVFIPGRGGRGMRDAGGGGWSGDVHAFETTLLAV
jgi:hypothetical protein